MKIVLAALATDTALAQAWQSHCAALPGVRVHIGSILDLDVDAVVSPANSFGFMDGGIDRIYCQTFGWDLETRVQELIRTSHDGELLVGQAAIVPTGSGRIPWLIVAPTMRVPMRLGPATVSPYLAARAALLKAQASGSGIKSLAFPGLGTGVGRVPPEIAARQVSAAIRNIVIGDARFPPNWIEAQAEHQMLYRDKLTDLQHEG